MTVITMTREMGSLGKDVAAGLAERLRLEVIHHELVEHDVAERMAMPESDVHRFLEGSPSLLERWKLGDGRLARCTAEEVVELATSGDVLIRGWGATSVLRRVPHVLRVRVCASMARRVRVMQDRLGIDDAKAARHEIERNDAAHVRAMRSVSETDFKDPLGYDLVLNTDRVPIEDCVEQVATLARSKAFEKTEHSRQILSDLLVETRVRGAIAKERTLSVRNLDLAVSDGVVRVGGVVYDNARAAELCAMLKGVAGVRSVTNRLLVPKDYAS